MPTTKKANPQRKGRPYAPHKIERAAIVTQWVNEGLSFKEAAERPILFVVHDPVTQELVLDKAVHARLPTTPAGRRTAMYKIRKELSDAVSATAEIFDRYGGPARVPLAYRINRPLKRGRPQG